MSDVTVAPARGGAPPAAPSQPSAPASEVAINQNPTNSPNPVGSQAPEAPPQRDSVSAAVDRAFERAQNPQGQAKVEKPAPKAAEARPGHNNPPEETPPERVEQPRDRGRFAPRQDAQNSANTAQNSANAAQSNAIAGSGQLGAQTPHVRTLPEHAPYRDAPPRFSEAGKRDWDSTTENVRADVHRMHQEFGKAYQAYRGAAEAFQPIARFHQMAQQHGTTLEQALTNYTGMEQKLRADPIAGLDTIIHNLGLKAPNGQPITLRDIAYHVLSRSPEQLAQVQQGNMQQAAAHQIGALHQEIAGLKNHLQQMHNQQQFTYTRSAVDQFAETHPRVDELAEPIKLELSLGFDLDTAYRRADALYPSTTHAAQTRTAPAQTRPQDRSISGFPDVAPSDGASRKPRKPSPTVGDAVDNAMRHVNGAH